MTDPTGKTLVDEIRRGKTCNCERCGKLCRTADSTNNEAVLIRKSIDPKGCCVNCAISCFIKTGPLAEVTGGAWSAPGFNIGEALRLPHIQRQFTAVFVAGGCAEVGVEIDWEQVIANWELPIAPGWDWRGETYMSKPKRARRSV